MEFALYYKEFLLVIVSMFFALLSPGPDFAFVLKQSIHHGQKSSIYTSFGLGFGVLVHIAYSILGIGLIISKSIILFNIIKFLGAFYLIYIGYKSLRSKGFKLHEEKVTKAESISHVKSFALGFLCNVLNPKAALFFVSLFTVIVNISTPLWVQCVYGLCAVFMTIVWFSLLSIILSSGRVRRFFNIFGKQFDRIMGVILILLGLKIAFSK